MAGRAKRRASAHRMCARQRQALRAAAPSSSRCRTLRTIFPRAPTALLGQRPLPRPPQQPLAALPRSWSSAPRRRPTPRTTTRFLRSAP